MPANNIDAIRQFVNGTTDSTLKERYLYALLNQIEKGKIFQIPAIFDSQVKPTLTHTKTIIYAIKSLLGEIARVESTVLGLRLTELAMREAVLGETPRIELTFVDGLLQPVADTAIIDAVEQQLLTDDLFQSLLNNNVIEVKVKL